MLVLFAPLADGLLKQYRIRAPRNKSHESGRRKMQKVRPVRLAYGALAVYNNILVHVHYELTCPLLGFVDIYQVSSFPIPL